MAQLALSIAGTIAGTAIGGPVGGVIGGTIGSIAGGFIDSLWMGNKGTPPRTDDTRVQVSTYGKSINLLYGTQRVAGEVIWALPLFRHKQNVSGSAKGRSSSAVTYTYTACFAVGLCEGPIGGVLRIWADSKLIADFRPAYYGKNALRAYAVRLYKGTEDQEPDLLITAWQGPDNPAYRGLAYLVFEQLRLEDFANRIPNITVEVVKNGSGVINPVYSEPSQLMQSNVEMGFFEPLTGQVFMNGGIVNGGLGGGGQRFDPNTRSVTTGGQNEVSFAAAGGDGFYYTSIDDNGSVYLDQTSESSMDRVARFGVGDGSDLELISGLKIRGNSFIGRTFGAGAVVWGALLRTGTDVTGIDYYGHSPDNGYTDVEIDANGNLWAVRTAAGSYFLDRIIRHDTHDFLAGGSLDVAQSIDLSSAWTSTDPSSGLLLIAGTNSLICGRGDYIIRYDLDAAAVTGAQFHAVGAQAAHLTPYKQLYSGYFVFGFNGSVTLFSAAGWVVYQTYNVGTTALPSGSLVPVYYIESLQTLITVTETDPVTSDGTTVYWSLLIRTQADVEYLGDVVTDLCEQAGLTSGDIDVSQITAIPVRGYVVSRQTPARTALEQLAATFLFDCVEEDDQLKFILRGGLTGAASLTRDDMGATTQEGNFEEPITPILGSEDDLPQEIALTFPNPDFDYQQAAARYRRNEAAIDTRNKLAIDTPVCLTQDEGRQLVEKIGFAAWVSRLRFEFPVSRQFLYLSPTDLVNLGILSDTGGTDTYFARLSQADFGADGILKLTAIAEDPEIYVSSGASGGGLLPNPRPIPTVYSASLIFLLDLNALRDADNDPGFYMAAGEADPTLTWIGAQVLRSIDDGASYQPFQTITTAVTWGSARTVLGDPAHWETWDRLNSVTIQVDMGADSIASTSELAVLNGANAALLGGEIIQFTNVVDNGDGTVTLSNLLRGRRGSDPAIGTHVQGERFVLLTTDAIKDIIQGLSELNLLRFYEGVTIGDASLPSPAVSFKDTGNRLKPYRVAHIAGSRDGSNNLTIAWVRRTRIGGEMQDLIDVPLSEDSEAYQVDILDSGTVVRTIDVTAESASYSAADQTADFGSPQSSIAINVYQMSGEVGRGYASPATV